MSDDSIRNDEDIIDSRDVIARLDVLAAQWQAHVNDETEPALDEEELEELRILTELNEQGEQAAPDWTYGEMMVRDSYFQRYAEELAEGIGAIQPDASWPASYIDWERAYTSIDFDGVTYWVR